MKSILSITLLVSAFSALAAVSVLDRVSNKVCRNKSIDYEREIATCSAKNAREILGAKVGVALGGEDIGTLDFVPMDPIELGIIAETETTVVYSYVRYVNDKKGAPVGVLTIEGYINRELGIKGRVDTRYNFEGEVVSIELK